MMSKRLNSDPIGARRHRVASLLGGVEKLFDPAMIAGIAPGLQQATDAMQLKNVLKRQCDVGSKNGVEGDGKDGVLGHNAHPIGVEHRERNARQLSAQNIPRRSQN